MAFLEKDIVLILCYQSMITTVHLIKLDTYLIDNYSGNLHLKEICFQTSERNRLCDLFHEAFHFYLDWYSNSTQKTYFK